MRPYLKSFPWEMVEAQNAVLCAARKAFHDPSSDGFSETKAFWEAGYQKAMSLHDTVLFLRRCHQLAPFCFYNGNTFASVALLVLKHLELTHEESILLRSLAGHIVAGVSTGEEEAAFKAFSDSLG